MLNRQQTGAVLIAISLLVSCYFAFYTPIISSPFEEEFVTMVPHVWSIPNVVLLFWLVYCAIVGTYLLLTDKSENAKNED